MKKSHITYLLVLISFVFFTNCKTTSTIKEGVSNFKLSAKQLIKANTQLEPDFKTLQAKLKITYTEGTKEQTHGVSFRMKKDEVIWISATFSIIRAKITPESVAFYNKLDKTYFKGDYAYLSNILGTELDYKKLQNLLLGEALFDLKNESYKVSIHEKEYALQPKKQQELFEIFYLLNPSHYKISSQQISQILKSRHLQIDYLSYQEVNNQKIPEKIKVLAVESNDETSVDLEFKSVVLNNELRFPFNIPSGFEAIKL